MATLWEDVVMRDNEEEIERFKRAGGTIIRDVSDYLDEQARRERESNDSIWSKIGDAVGDVYGIAKGAALDVWNEVRDYFTERFNRLSWANAVLIGDVYTEIETSLNKEELNNMTLIGDVGGYLDGELDKSRQPDGFGQGLIFDWIDKRLEGVADAFSVAFQHLAPVVAALLEIPAQVLFTLIRDLLFEEVSE